MASATKRPSEVAMRAAREVAGVCGMGAFDTALFDKLAAIIDRHLEQERDELAACKSLRCELVTIFGLPPERTGATWNERMLGHIGTHLAAVEQERQEVRQVLTRAMVAVRYSKDSVFGRKEALSWLERAESLLARMGEK